MNRDGSLTLLYSLYRENKYIKCKMGVVCMYSAYARKTRLFTQCKRVLERFLTRKHNGG